MREKPDLWKTVRNELQRAQDLETAVLKTHLFIETMMNGALEALIGPGVERARLSFVQKLEVLVCLLPFLKEKDSSIHQARCLYDSWLDLNRIRNLIAHVLSPLRSGKHLLAG